MRNGAVRLLHDLGHGQRTPSPAGTPTHAHAYYHHHRHRHPKPPSPKPHCTTRRLLHDLDYVERNLAFWEARLAAGSHNAFMLLSRGPISFLRDVAGALHVLRLGRGGHAGAAAEEALDALELEDAELLEQQSATEKMQHRVRARAPACLRGRAAAACWPSGAPAGNGWLCGLCGPPPTSPAAAGPGAGAVVGLKLPPKARHPRTSVGGLAQTGAHAPQELLVADCAMRLPLPSPPA